MTEYVPTISAQDVAAAARHVPTRDGMRVEYFVFRVTDPRDHS